LKNQDDVHIGTSGWHYDHWKGTFYPQDMRAEDFLSYYCQQFNTVEINNSFYQLPDAETLAEWRDTVPKGFIFSVKASRYITHMKKLKDPQEPVETFMERIKVLEAKLGPILFQLPPNWNINPERLNAFLDQLPAGYQYTFEFRDPSWFEQSIYEALEKHNAAFCMYHLSHRISPKPVTSDFIYIRLHGPDDAYQGKYDPQELSGWAGALSTWQRQSKEIYCYFDNDEKGYAPQDAKKLKGMLEH
jgi:uncharacterized protein YecE (DUF72 family)